MRNERQMHSKVSAKRRDTHRERGEMEGKVTVRANPPPAALANVLEILKLRKRQFRVAATCRAYLSCISKDFDVFTGNMNECCFEKMPRNI